ncbi:MAG: ATP-binding protein [Persicimonas sp.]
MSLSRSKRELRDVNAVNFDWLIKLRWVAVVGQTALIGAARWLLDFGLPLGGLFGIIALTAATNVGLQWWQRRGRGVSEGLLAGVLIADMGLLTLLLFLTGGPANPFSFLYLVHISLAAVVLRRNWLVSGVFVLAGALYGVLFLVHTGWHEIGAGSGGHMRSHMEGMWVAMVVTGGLTAYFIHTIRRALQRHEDALDAFREDEARREKLASLATMAAGAAHELSTPLSLIAVVAKELELRLEDAGDEHAVEDAVLIREQVRRCQQILGQISTQAGRHPGESSRCVEAAELADQILERVRACERVQLDDNSDGACARVPLNAVAGAVAELIHNALDASDDAGVRLELGSDADWLYIEVVDRGGGMAPEVAARAGDPFFTTKGPDEGMGIGLYLASQLFEQLGGALEIDSEPGRGTRVGVRLPRATRTST